jgi:mannose-1-phosphate guanylyltransferase
LNIQSDNFINKEDHAAYAAALKQVAQSLESNQFDLVTCGIKPSFPNTQLGYVEIEETQKEEVFKNPVRVKQFREKPNYETALDFVENGNFFWHWGTYSFTYNSLIKMVSEYMPKYVDLVEKIRETGEITMEVYSQFEKISWDYAINEKCKNMGIIALDMFWDDIGTWKTVSSYLPKIDNKGNIYEIAGSDNKARLSDKKRKVAFVGVSGLTVVENEEGILIIDPNKSAEVKEVAKYFDK